MSKKFKYTIIQRIDDEYNGNADVVVELFDNQKYVVTFFTIENVKHLMQKWKITKELGKGTYFWATNYCIIERLDNATIECCIEDLLENDDFYEVFMKI